MIARMRQLAKALLESRGYRITRVPVAGANPIDTIRATLASAGGKPVLLDVGARDGAASPWRELHAAGALSLALVEPDAEECRRLEVGHPGVQVLPYALGDTESERTLHVTVMPGCSSLLEPHAEHLRDFPVRAWFDVVSRHPVRVRRYDGLVREGQAPAPAFVKIDVQGFEWNVLEGFGDVLRDVLAIELEAHFVALYRGERTAFELLPWLRERGFVLRHVERQGFFEEEFIEGNFFFSRRPQTLSPRDRAWLSVWEAACAIPAPLPFASRKS